MSSPKQCRGHSAEFTAQRSIEFSLHSSMDVKVGISRDGRDLEESVGPQLDGIIFPIHLEYEVLGLEDRQEAPLSREMADHAPRSATAVAIHAMEAVDSLDGLVLSQVRLGVVAGVEILVRHNAMVTAVHEEGEELHAVADIDTTFLATQLNLVHAGLVLLLGAVQGEDVTRLVSKHDILHPTRQLLLQRLSLGGECPQPHLKTTHVKVPAQLGKALVVRGEHEGEDVLGLGHVVTTTHLVEAGDEVEFGLDVLDLDGIYLDGIRDDEESTLARVERFQPLLPPLHHLLSGLLYLLNLGAHIRGIAGYQSPGDDVRTAHEHAPVDLGTQDLSILQRVHEEYPA